MLGRWPRSRDPARGLAYLIYNRPEVLSERMTLYDVLPSNRISRWMDVANVYGQVSKGTLKTRAEKAQTQKNQAVRSMYVPLSA